MSSSCSRRYLAQPQRRRVARTHLDGARRATHVLGAAAGGRAEEGAQAVRARAERRVLEGVAAVRLRQRRRRRERGGGAGANQDAQKDVAHLHPPCCVPHCCHTTGAVCPCSGSAASATTRAGLRASGTGTVWYTLYLTLP